jgi:hypothetical protein
MKLSRVEAESLKERASGSTDCVSEQLTSRDHIWVKVATGAFTRSKMSALKKKSKILLPNKIVSVDYQRS